MLIALMLRPLMKSFFLYFLLLFLGLPLTSPAQADTPRSTEGWFVNPYGQLHIMVIYAEMDFDSSYNKMDPEKNPEGGIGWKKKRLPFWRNKLIARTPDGDGFMTNYFRQASFGKFQVTGDYLDTIITVPISSIRNNRNEVVTQEAYGNNLYRKAVLDRVNAIPNPRFGLGSSLEDFDQWTFTGNGKPNANTPNQKIDLVMLIWRNIHVAYLGDNSGFVSPGSMGKLFGMETDMNSIFHTSSMLPDVIMRHEFSHLLYGGNNFHTAGGGVGTRTFMSTIGGWSNMSAADACTKVWNAWDRERLGWGNPDNQYVLSARCADSGQEIDGALSYGQALCGNGIVKLRDFVTMGDAIKIKLPHLPPDVKNQYIWLENHQRREGYIDHDRAMVPGVYAYIQVGKDTREGPGVFAGENNYLWPLVAAGHYDFSIDSVGLTLVQESDRANPFTGYHYLMRHTLDINGDGKILILPDNGAKTEYHMPQHLRIDGVQVADSEFTYMNYPLFGMRSIAFLPENNNKIGMGTNPAATPVYSHGGAKPLPNDNRRIYLSGLSIELLRIDLQGDAYLKIRWDDFEVKGKLRWCGDILLTEQLILTRGTDLRLSQGTSPQVATAIQTIDERRVFAEPTILELKSGSQTTLQANSQLIVEKGSTLLIRKGAKLSAHRTAKITLQPGAYLYVESGTDLSGISTSQFVFAQGASRGMHPLLLPKFKDLLPVAP